MLDDSVDERTGQKLFQPKINNYKLNRNLANVDIGDYLYSRKDMIESNRQERSKQLQHEAEQLVSAKKVNTRSEKLCEQKKLKKFGEIFAVLDSDADGVISAQDIDIDTINPDVLQIINELLVEMEEKGKTLDLPAFCAGMGKF